MKILHLGCGRKIQSFKDLFPEDEVVSLDADERLNPDIVCTLGVDPIPIEDNSVDCAVAIHVLEHIGKQGEAKDWFYFWEELYRVFKPNAYLEFESPLATSIWAWADPTHSRALSPQSFIFFCQDNYRIKDSAISPYRINCDFIPLGGWQGVQDTDPSLSAVESVSHFRGTLSANKPLKAWWLDT